MKKTVFDKIDEQKANREKLIKELEAKQEIAEKEYAAKEAAAEKILESGTVEDTTAEAYVTAKAASREASDKLEFIKKRVTELNSGSFFTDEDREKYRKEIREYVMTAEAPLLKNIKDHLTIAAKDAEESRALFVKANDYITTILGTNDSYMSDIIGAAALCRMLNNAIK